MHVNILHINSILFHEYIWRVYISFFFFFFSDKRYKLVNVKHKLRNQRSVRDVIHLQLNSDNGTNSNSGFYIFYIRIYLRSLT